MTGDDLLASDLTFHDLIARNRRRTWWLVAAICGLCVLLLTTIAAAVMVWGFGVITWQGLLAAAVASGFVAGGASLWSYYGGASAVLALSGARPMEKDDDPQLFNVVEELAIAAGVPMPAVYRIPSDALNAFATGRDPEHAAVAITTGLRERLTRDELQGVLAHEMSHVRNLDIRLMMMVATLVGLIVLAADVFTRTLWHVGRAGGGGMGADRGRGGRREGGGGGGAVMLLVLALALVLGFLAPLLAQVIRLAVSRQREYLADAGAVELTRNPKGLADALRKLAADETPLKTANRATAHLFIVNPLLNARGRSNVDSVFSTHPPMAERIRRLEALLR